MKKVAEVKSKILGCQQIYSFWNPDFRVERNFPLEKKTDTTIKKREKAAPYKHQFRGLKAPGASFISTKTNISTMERPLNKVVFLSWKTITYESSLSDFTVNFSLSPRSGFSLNFKFIAIFTQPSCPFFLP